MNKRSKEEKRTINNNEPRDRQSDRQKIFKGWEWMYLKDGYEE